MDISLFNKTKGKCMNRLCSGVRMSGITLPNLLEPYEYLQRNPGKEVRSRIIDAFNHWLNVPDHKLASIKQVVEMLHNSSLLY
jgi:geranylgeranyl pyrophosphate synthase